MGGGGSKSVKWSDELTCSVFVDVDKARAASTAPTAMRREAVLLQYVHETKLDEVRERRAS